MGRLMDEVGREYKGVMVYASYLLGHIDGLGGSVEEVAPKVIEMLRSTVDPNVKTIFRPQ